MRSLKLLKFLAVFAFFLAMSSACRYCQKTGGENSAPTPFAAEELKSEIPFSTKEPDIFQVEIVTTANDREDKIFMARDGAKRRVDYDLGKKGQATFLQSGKNYLLLSSKKIYAETPAESATFFDGWTDFLTSRWLNAKTDVKFFNDGTAENLTKYRIVFGDAEKSESLIFVDETVNLPIRQEFYSVDGEQKTLTMKIEFRNLKLEADAEMFAIPNGFRKVSIEEFRSVLRKENE